MDKDKDYLTILLPEIKEDNTDTNSPWQYKNGLIISAPANTKKEAIENANKFLQYCKDFIFSSKSYYILFLY